MANKVDDTSDRPCELSYQFIKHITNGFDEALIVARGEFGTIYKGFFETGEEITVKVFMSGYDSKRFQKELDLLRRLKHENVVELVGFCNESDNVVAEYNGKHVVAEEIHMVLCFEYLHNGSLAKHISDDGCSGLNWHIQFKIIKGICKGLEYLQNGLDFPVWHLDLKPASIFLDKDMIPKIADFGLSRLSGDKNTSETINPIKAGSYVPTEYIEQGLITQGFDIFVLGVIIAKLMSGNKGYYGLFYMTTTQYIKQVCDSWRKRLSETLAPSSLEVYCEQVKKCIEIAVDCRCNNEPKERPTIQFIVSSLVETEIMILNLGLRTEHLRDDESVLSKGGIEATPPG